MTEAAEITQEVLTANLSLGDRLKAAREEKNLSVEQVCANLRLGQKQVQALESNDFDVLPDAMITRGFIRNYARLLGLDAEPLLQAYRMHSPEPLVKAISIPSANIVISNEQKKLWMPYAIASAVIALLLAVWFVYMEYKPAIESGLQEAQLALTDTVQDASKGAAVETKVPASVEPLPVPALPQAERSAETASVLDQTTGQLVDAPIESAVDSQLATSTEPAISPVAEAHDVPAPDVTAPKLLINCKESSWVNIRDRDNKLIFDQVLPAGAQQSVEGTPPFKIVIGNAVATQLTYNDQNVDLAPHTKVRVARLTLE